jgi:hypothetical protein
MKHRIMARSGLTRTYRDGRQVVTQPEEITTLCRKAESALRRRAIKPKMCLLKLFDGPLAGHTIDVEDHGSGLDSQPDTLPITLKGQTGRYVNGKWERLASKPPAPPKPPMPDKPITIKPTATKTSLADIPPPPAHLAAEWLDYKKESMMRYRALYCIKHGLTPRVTITPREWVTSLGLLREKPGGGYTVTDKGEALFLTHDPAVTERYLDSLGA